MPDKSHTIVDTEGRVCTKCIFYKIWDDFEFLAKGINGRRSSCRDCNRDRYRKSRQTYQQRTKREIIDTYGGVCACCGEENIGFLTIDHVNNDGAEHRREIGNRGGNAFYLWLRKNDYPDGFQVLCWNCNCGRQYNGGACPHTQEEVVSA